MPNEKLKISLVILLFIIGVVLAVLTGCAETKPVVFPVSYETECCYA